ncbi:hypothetical protein [Pleurocapsa sp. PCC 7319]|nr:hypothetical protein [Pleurocapsa sp. PCC 7319]
MSQKENIENWKRVEYLLIKKNQQLKKINKKVANQEQKKRQILERCYQN